MKMLVKWHPDLTGGTEAALSVAFLTSEGKRVSMYTRNVEGNEGSEGVDGQRNALAVTEVEVMAEGMGDTQETMCEMMSIEEALKLVMGLM